MRLFTESNRQVMTRVLGLAAVLSPMPASAMTGNGDVRLLDLAAERRFVISISAVGDAPERSVTLRIPITATLHRFRAELLNAAGQPIGLDASWGVTIFSATPLAEGYEGAAAMARLTNGSNDLRVPRPYGVRLPAGDSITVVASLPTTGAPGATLRITIDYESEPATRIAAVAIASTETVATGTWTWRVEFDGRLVAIAGRQLLSVKELVLEDVTTGHVVWRTRTHYEVPGVEGQQSEVVRPGVSVWAGRIYRLRAVYAESNREQTHGGDTPIALVFPDGSSSGAR